MRAIVGKLYRFSPTLLDAVMPEHYRAVAGQTVRVINLPGAPKANTMGQCHIESESGEFLGMVSVNSLAEVKRG